MASPSYVSMKRFEVINKVHAGGLGVEARFTRQPHLYSPKMLSVELTFINHTQSETFTDIKISSKVSIIKLVDSF
jgi:AP-3 complex subunit beta